MRFLGRKQPHTWGLGARHAAPVALRRPKGRGWKPSPILGSYDLTFLGFFHPSLLEPVGVVTAPLRGHCYRNPFQIAVAPKVTLGFDDSAILDF
ncbi:protein of unknown function (plasmid) [Rhodovastum atsumiense]|nr:protein of unknown function [Rhodovastum atsumiense]